jgi:hypothetical protein
VRRRGKLRERGVASIFPERAQQGGTDCHRSNGLAPAVALRRFGGTRLRGVANSRQRSLDTRRNRSMRTPVDERGL